MARTKWYGQNGTIESSINQAIQFPLTILFSSLIPLPLTTAAVITIMQKVADLLVSNRYVTIIALDFSKAFDTVRHHELAKKLTKL